MASTTFVDYTVPAVNAAWLNDVNDGTYQEYNADLVAAELAAGVTPANPLYPAEDIRRYSNFQDAIDVGNVTFPPGTYNYAADFNIPSNRKIWVQKGATVINTGGRFTSYGVNNVEWHIDGWVKSVAMAPASYKSGWPNSTTGGSSLGNERGFIEFGGTVLGGCDASGFWVHGTGKVSGDWTGTPNFSDPATIINNKGIAAFAAKNVFVDGLEVFGFNGEAIYCYGQSTACVNWVFTNNYVHDTRFNALNFNAQGPFMGLLIANNTAYNSFSGVETSVGSVISNHIDTCPDTNSCGIWTGAGGGNGPIRIVNNVVNNCALHGIAVSFGAVKDNITIQNNILLNSGQNSIYTSRISYLNCSDNLSVNPGLSAIYLDNTTHFKCADNIMIGTATTGNGHNFALVDSSLGVLSDNLGLDPGAFALPDVFLSCTDISVSGQTEVLTSGADVCVDGGVGEVASSATMTLPQYQSIFRITGTTTITGITATEQAGRTVTLIFAGALTMTDGGNLKLAGDFVTSADDTMTLVCDGTNWYETTRSAN